MRAILLLLACVVTTAGCDGLLGINQHSLEDAGHGERGEGGEGADGGGVTIGPGADGGAHADASPAGEE